MNDTPVLDELNPRQRKRARTLGARLQPDVFGSVQHYGLYAQVRLAGIADEVMTLLDACANDRTDLVRLLERMKRLDPSFRLRHPLQRLLPTLGRGFRREDTIFDRYERLCLRLDRMLPQLEAVSGRISKALTSFDTLLERNQTYLSELDMLIYGALMRLDRFRTSPPSRWKPQSADLIDHTEPLARQVERLEQRIADLEACADTARETGPTIRRVQEDLRTLLMSAQDYALNTATRWKHEYADAVTRVRRVDDATELPEPPPLTEDAKPEQERLTAFDARRTKPRDQTDWRGIHEAWRHAMDQLRARTAPESGISKPVARRAAR